MTGLVGHVNNTSNYNITNYILSKRSVELSFDKSRMYESIIYKEGL